MRFRVFVKRAFSLLEVIVSIFIVGLIISVGALTFGETVSRESSRGLAYNLGAELRAARSAAMQSEKFVAVCIPHGGDENPFSRSFEVRAGYDRGELLRRVNFDQDLSAAVYSGRWPGDTLLVTPNSLPPWLREQSDHYRLIFRPDGTAFSQDLGELEGKYHFVVASRMEGTSSGLIAASNPTTIWVSKAGTIGVLSNALPVGSLPPSGVQPLAATLAPAVGAEGTARPELESLDFLPLKVDQLDNVGLGQTAVQIHPQQKLPGLGQNGVEYGLTTFRFRAKDRDGGPLRFSLSAEASRGEAGNFSFQETNSALGPTIGGQMNFVLTENDEWLWESVISWRPPPGAPTDTVYDFTLTLEDPEGHRTEIVSGADLMPRMVLLRPENLVYETNEPHLLMTNLDGTSHRRLTDDEEPESKPFFSSDGTRLYSFFETPAELALITRNSDGTQRRKLQTFPLSHFRKLTFDPFKNYAAYLAGSSEQVTVTHQVVKETQVTISTGGSGSTDTGSGGTSTTTGSGGTTTGSGGITTGIGSTETITIYSLEDGPPESLSIDRLEVMHLNSGKKVNISEHAQPNFRWYGNPRFGLSFSEIHIFDDDDKVDPPAQHPRAIELGLAAPLPRYIPSPGYRKMDRQVLIRGYPPAAEPTTLPPLGAGVESEIFNLARPQFYLRSRDSAPSLTFHDTTATLPDATILSPKALGPSWSGDGRWVLYAREQGGEILICRKQVLNASLDGMDLRPEEVLYSANSITSPQLSSGGEYAFFLRGGDIYRLQIDGGGSPINITENLAPNVRSFVLSP